MKNKAKTKNVSRNPILAQFLFGIVIMAVVTFISVQADMSATYRVLATTTHYIKEQCNRYARIDLAAETKSLMRLIESCKQVSHMLVENEGFCTEEIMEEYSRDCYVTGILLLDSDGKIQFGYDAEGKIPELLKDAITSPALVDIIKYPEKRYAVRLHCSDGSEIDLAAMKRKDREGIVVTYYHTPLEYIDSFNLSIESLLSGFSMENDGTIVVSSGDMIVASNDESLIGMSTNDIPILRAIKSSEKESKLTHTKQISTSISQYFGLMERGRDFYVYSFLPERSVFSNTPRTMIYTLIAYIVILGVFSAVRWRTAQKAQKEYARQLQTKNELLSVAVKEADKANAAKTSFLSRMSHDIRTPLNGIIGLLEIDAAHPDDKELVNANRNKMRVAADHLLSLINDILQMSKLESGEITLAHEILNLNQLAEDVLTIISQRAAEFGITIISDKDSQSPSFPWVYGSPLHLRQIFLNIYTNCIKYNKVGGSISTLFECVNRSGNIITYRWTITDTGIGMSEEFMQHIFDPFTQENSDARSVYQGTGLGMTIVKGLIEQMKGNIQVRSQEGIGSTFVITIPFTIAEKKESTVSETEETITEERSIQGMHLMLAEDNELNQEIAQVLLTDAGAFVTTVKDGKSAVDLFENNPEGTFDAILMDVMMPVMDGLTATRTIRNLKRPDAKTIPIISMTANAFTEDAEKCLAAGMNAHLAKPLEIQKVIVTIEQQVRSCRERME